MLCLFVYPRLEQLAAVFVVLEEVEARAGGREQHCVTGLCGGFGGLHRGVERAGGDHIGHHTRELFDQLGVVRAHADERMYLRTGESLQRFVVVAFVRAPGDPYHGACHAFERIVYRVDIGGLGIVDPQYAVGFPDGFEAVADGGEAVDRAADRGRRDACRKGRKSRGHVPSTILFYNSGAYITCEDSASIEDLKSLEAQGVEILTCGTCLNFYGITDKLQVGEVTNMYVIAEKMTQADLIVQP